MADGTVDNLNIQLSADANKAVQSLNSLKSALNSINTAFSKDISGMRKFSKEIGTLSASMRSLSNIKFSFPDLSGMNKMLKSLKGIDASKAKNAADGIEKVVNSFNKLGSANFNDSGINKTVNALNRLFKVDMSKFNPNDFEKITNAISKLGNMPDVSSGVNRFVSALSRLANAGEKTKQSASGILRLGNETAEAARRLQSVGAINDDVNLFVQSIGRLASAGAKASQTASGLRVLATETIAFFNAMAKAPKISQNTIQMVQALAQLASAGGKVGTSINSITSAMEKLSSVSEKVSSVVHKVSGKIVSAFDKIRGSTQGLTLSFGNLLSTAIGFQAFYGLINFGKQAFQLGSDITEVENVVNVAFGNMADKAYEFASTATEQFGLSELAALRYAGTMRSVLNSSGVEAGMATQMSTDLAGLAGDLASFYNISQDNAWEKIMSGMAGEIEPLRRLGINMSVANMEAYALSQGITESWQSMTQAEQVMLRYNYLMDTTSAQQGDFARTSGTWANQIRLLQLNIQQLAATIGQGLISAVLPAVTALNKLFTVLQKAAVAVRNFFYVLTGYDGGGSSGFTTEIQGAIDASDGLDDVGAGVSDNLDDAAKSAKDLETAILGIDELNIISPETSSAGSGSGGASSGSASGGDIGLDNALSDIGGRHEETYFNAWAERIRKAFLSEDWEGLGEEIAWGLNKGLQKVYDVVSWDNVGPKIESFTRKFTRTFNSLVDSFDWDLLGRTAGAGINTVANTINGFVERINWSNIGNAFSEGINGAVSEINWANIGRTLGNGLMIPWKMLLSAATNLDFGQVGRSLATGLNNAIAAIDLGTVGQAIAKTFSGIVKMFGEFARNADWAAVGQEIASGINGFLDDFSISDLVNTINDIVDGIRKALWNAIKKIKWGDIFNEITDAIGNIELDSLAAIFVVAIPQVTKFKKALDDIPLDKLINGFKKFTNLFKGNFFKNLATGAKNLVSQMSMLQKTAVGAVAVFAQFSLSKDAFHDLAAGGDNVVQSLVKIAAGAATTATALKLMGLSNPFTAIITAGTALISALIGINQGMNEVAENSMFETLETTGTVTLEELGEVAIQSFDNITSGIDKTSEKLEELKTAKDNVDSTVDSIESIKIAIDNGAYSANEKVPEIIDQFQNLLDQSKKIFEEEYNVIAGNVMGAWADVLEAQGVAVPEAVAQLASLRDQGTAAYSDLESSLQSLIEQYNNGAISSEEFIQRSTPMFDQLKAFNDEGIVDKTAKSISDFGGALDLSQYIDEDSFDTSGFESYVNTVTTTALDGKNNLQTIGEENNQAIADFRNQLDSLGVDTSSVDWAALYGASDEQVASGVANIDSAYEQFANQIQYNLLNQLPSIVEDASKDYDKLPWWQKLFKTEDSYVKSEVNSWKEKVLNPASETLKDGFDQLGIDGELWAGEAANKITESLFMQVGNDSSGYYSVGLKNNWQNMLQTALDGAAEAIDVSSYGTGTVSSYNSGIDSSKDSSYKKIQEWMDGIDKNIHDSSMNFGSPSKTAIQYGKDTVYGFNEGISISTSSTKSVINGYMQSVVNSFSSNASRISSAISNALEKSWLSIKTIFAPAPEYFSSVFKNAYSAIKNAFQFINSWFSEKWTATKNVFRDVNSFFRSGFQTAYDSVKNIWSGLDSFFKNLAKNSFAPMEKMINGIIKGVNWILKEVDSGTRISEWGGVKFAKGTSGLKKNTVGVVNDQKGSVYREMIVPPNGKAFIPKGRNVMLPLQKGTKIMPANQTKEFLKNFSKIPHFADGVGSLFAWNTRYSGDMMDYLNRPDKATKIGLDRNTNVSDVSGMWRKMVKGIVKTSFDGISDFVKEEFEKVVPKVDYNPSAGVEQWRSLAKYALKLEGQYTIANLNRMLMQMKTESGGNPRAINLWDSNAKRGTPSKGLMQVIDPTFQRWAKDGYDKNIYDPLSNMLASIRYTLNRYGSLAAGWKGHGYASGIGKINLSDLFGKIPALAGGGTLMSGQLFVANERGPELIGRYGNRTTVMNNDQVVESVSTGVEKAIQRQNDETNALLRQILDYQQRLLAKDTSTNLDGKRTDSLLQRARRNSGYNFRPAGGTV